MGNRYKVEISELLHDVSNQLQVLNGEIFKNREKLDKSYPKINGILLSIGKTIDNISLSNVNEFKVEKSKITSKDFVGKLQSIISVYSDLYISTAIESDLIKTDSSVFYNEFLFKQLLLNLYDNSRKAKSKNMFVNITDHEKYIKLIFKDHGEKYKSNTKGSYFQGIGLKSMERICEFLSYELKSTEQIDSFSIMIKISKQ